MKYGLSVTLDRPFDDVETDVRGALAQQGFGIVSEINLQETLRTKIGVEIGRQLILGACNPTYAHRALQAEPSIGLLLPCNVVIRSTDDGTVVEMINAQMLVQVTDNPDMGPLVTEVNENLEAAMAAVRRTA